MKNILLFFSLTLFFDIFSQKANLITIQNDYKLIHFNTSIKNIEKNSDYEVNLNVQNYHVNYCVLHGKISWFIGLSYMKTNYVIPDRITHWNYVLYGEDNLFGPYPYDTIYQVYQDPADYVATATNLGINNEILYHLKPIGKKKKLNQALGLKNELYLLEGFEQAYEVNDEVENSEAFVVGNSETPQALPDYQTSIYSVYNTNLSAFYQIRWFPHDAFSLGMRISAGANLYSDWDKFKKYAWLSAGLEMGFLAKKNKQPTP